MDITPMFKKHVQAAREQNQTWEPSRLEDPNRIFSLSSKGSSKFQIKAKDIVCTVTKLNDYLLENKRSYLDIGSLLYFQGSKLSEADRSDMDSNIQIIIKKCFQQVQDLKKENDNLPANPQTREHRQIVIDIVEVYLKSVCTMYQDIKEHYQKRKMELEKVTKLEGDALKKMSHTTNDSGWDALSDTISGNPFATKSLSNPSSHYNEDDNKTEEQINFTVADVQLFEKENSLLFNELNSLNEEVNQIQNKVVKIAGLQVALTEKIFEQEKDINRIITTTISATENIREGNDQLRQALQSNSGFRIAIIFFILVLFFSVLFLDWYND